jgi:hypothetical protein
MYDTEDVFELMTFHDTSSCLTILLKFRSKTPLKKLRKPKPEPNERTMMVLELNKGHGPNKAASSHLRY